MILAWSNLLDPERCENCMPSLPFPNPSGWSIESRNQIAHIENIRSLTRDGFAVGDDPMSCIMYPSCLLRTLQLGPFWIGRRRDHMSKVRACLAVVMAHNKASERRGGIPIGRLVLAGTVLEIKACPGSCQNLLGLEKVESVHGFSQNSGVNSTSEINLVNIRHQKKSVLSQWQHYWRHSTVCFFLPSMSQHETLECWIGKKATINHPSALFSNLYWDINLKTVTSQTDTNSFILSFIHTHPFTHSFINVLICSFMKTHKFIAGHYVVQ